MAEDQPLESVRNRFTQRGYSVVRATQSEAQRLHAAEAEPLHLILGLLKEEEGLAAVVLTNLGVTHDSAVDVIETVLPQTSESETPYRLPPLSRDLRKTLDLSLREALSLGHNYIGTEHILLGLIRSREGPTKEALELLDLEADDVRNEVIRILSGPGPRRDPQKPEAEQVDEKRIEAVPMHGDRPADRDELGRRRLAEVLGERIRRVREEDTETAAGGWRQRLRKRRRDAAAAARAGGFLVHIYAPWGAGKSSLLRFLAADLRNRSELENPSPGRRFRGFFRFRKVSRPSLSQWIVVEFSAWEHQRLAPPWWWLLAEVQRSCARELWHINRGRWCVFWLREFGWRLWNARAAVIAASLVGLVVGAAWLNNWFSVDVGSLSALQKVLLTTASAIALLTTLLGMTSGAARWLAIGSAAGADRFLRRSPDPLGVYRRRFRWLVRSCGYPVTIFIDDLDRCRPEYVVELLEGIHTLFIAEPVTYIIAADRSWLCQSFATAYDDFQDTVGETGRPLGFLFLEKTFQISFEIPPLSKQDHERYWAGLLRGAADTGVSTVGSDTTPSVGSLASANNPEEVEDRLDRMLEEGAADEEDLIAAMRRLNAPEMQEQLEKLLLEFAPLLESNPRSMKRLMNAYGIERDRLIREGRLLNRKERRQLALLTILRMRWPLLAEHLRDHPEDAAFCRASTPPPDHPFEQLFKNRELRALFSGAVVGEQLNAAHLTDFPPENGAQSGSRP